MVSDEEIAQTVETVLRHSDPNAVTSLNGVVQCLEAKLGLSLAHKSDFIRDQITFLLRSHPVSREHLPPQPHPFPQPPHFSLHHQTHPAYPQPPPKEENAAANASETHKGRAPAGTKRRGGPGGLNKLCGVSPKLQAIVGQPELPRTEIVKQLWVYIRKHNLQDPENKRKIICDDALRLVFETDCTDMFKMNKLLAKHILRLDPTKEPVQAKKSKVEDDSTKQSSDPSLLPVAISDELAKFFGTGEKEMLRSEALGLVWEYIQANQLEDPLSSMVIHCDGKLQELLGCESISALGIQEMLLRHHLPKQC
ncbi:hypothetical protein SASPL_146596 [Salvia splendens]|uniref:Upstream activation factor subunit UAF30 n=1 Tax=Salvia splendens TaxID=180675 RepID=A0A8X8WDX3_SALSN|nr:uncharacterized protein LOC121777617 [Salvia splendens]XP_042030861.1 uncharacterized protein LOC121777617 [Salvia splendens]KAG6392379.1 hypothetical protein SASPL_146596 [Salvia splendens]